MVKKGIFLQKILVFKHKTSKVKKMSQRFWQNSVASKQVGFFFQILVAFSVKLNFNEAGWLLVENLSQTPAKA